ncbi:hypothetical protein PAXINDRAFT_169359 [Paxillus involutus ATCC 200175]|uniref:Unplaced genomic scaffold PAXINscaffold_17, whole genome shotgun sequence n=1 Tax=Paxillus involutus ATCC 200175 TaxID=664439 RepID=A0A0C9TGR5_PAXIN|nr:hypothetical protein PAXINDRAFT_169359 [Paxillus involutus ATCC 200175]
MSQVTVNVSGIAPSTTRDTLHDFFSFCGKINSIDIKEEGDPKSAVVTFEKHSAANTALMLNGGTLDGATLTVTSDAEHADHHDAHDHQHHDSIEQSDKPRAGIAAEYLAKGYKLSDHILQRAIDLDNKQGISSKFLSYMSNLDKSVGERALGPDQTVSSKVQSTFKQAHTRAKTIDEQKGYSKVAHEYYSKALCSPLGQSVFSFYTNTSKQVRDIHEEAVRIKEHKPQSPASTSPAPAPATAGASKA